MADGGLCGKRVLEWKQRRREKEREERQLLVLALGGGCGWVAKHYG